MTIDAKWYDLGEASNFIKLDGIEFRSYQFNIIKGIFQGRNTLVVLPTGLGKTLIGMYAIANALSKGKKALFLSPTKPLSEQHYSNMGKYLNTPQDTICLMTGSTSASKRKGKLEGAQVVIATPQTVMNDLKNNIINLGEFGVVIFDECHKAVGKYAYTYIANECVLKEVQMIGLTASPGSRKEKIDNLINTLGISNIEIRISTDEDVAKYIMPKDLKIINVDKSSGMKKIASMLKPLIDENMQGLRQLGLMPFRNFENMPKGVLIDIGNNIKKIEAKNYKFSAISCYTKLLNLTHAYDLLETEGIYPYYHYIDSLYHKEPKSRSLESLLRNQLFSESKRIAKEMMDKGEEHPKVNALVDYLRLSQNHRVIVFAQYRSTISMLVERLNSAGFSSCGFVGKRDGVTQEQQKQVISEFASGKFNILVASSIGEEGLDIPNVDLVVFYEPISSEIRNIQRKGRTGRLSSGNIVVLVTKDTKDQLNLFMSARKEEKMFKVINSIKRSLDKKSLEKALKETGQRHL